MDLLRIDDKTRLDCGYVNTAKKFEDSIENHQKFRKSLIVISVFSLIYNFAGITIDGSNIGLISGKISNPKVIGAALFISLIYFLSLYIVFILSKYSEYLLSFTNSEILKGFYTALVKYYIENNIKQELAQYQKLKVLNVKTYQTNHFSYDNQSFIVYYSPWSIDEIEKELNENARFDYDNEVIKLLNKNGMLVSNHPSPYHSPLEKELPEHKKLHLKLHYKATDEDEKFLLKYFRYLKLFNTQIFIEYRLPVVLAISALYSYSLRFQSVLDFYRESIDCLLNLF